MTGDVGRDELLDVLVNDRPPRKTWCRRPARVVARALSGDDHASTTASRETCLKTAFASSIVLDRAREVLGTATALATSVRVSPHDILTRFHRRKFHHTREMGRVLISPSNHRELLTIHTFPLDQSDDSLKPIHISDGATPMNSI